MRNKDAVLSLSEKSFLENQEAEPTGTEPAKQEEEGEESSPHGEPIIPDAPSSAFYAPTSSKLTTSPSTIEANSPLRRRISVRTERLAQGNENMSRALGNVVARRRVSAHRQWWDCVRPAPKDPITSVSEAFLADTSPNKINLGVGAYRDEEGKPVVLRCVRNAEAKVAGSEFLESISALANSRLVEESIKLVYGKDTSIIGEGRMAGVQTLSGTSACRLFAEFQRRFCPRSKIYFPDPTWSNHHSIWKDAEVPQSTFSYYDPKSKGLNFPALIDDIKNAPEGSFFLLHPCAHNPTGVDPTEEEWREISYHLKVKNHFPFFDMAYQGFSSGNLDRDAQAIRTFLQDGHLIGCAQSFAKNMGLYGHRVGCLSILCTDTMQAVAVKSQLQQIARAMYGSLPIHGVLLVSTILGDPATKALWVEELRAMANRVGKIREALRESLENLGSPLNWEHITNQVGMFCFSGMTPRQIEKLQREFHIYMTADGRISMAGVTMSNMDYLANAIHEVTKSSQES